MELGQEDTGTGTRPKSEIGVVRVPFGISPKPQWGASPVL